MAVGSTLSSVPDTAQIKSTETGGRAPRNIVTSINYYDDPGDGSSPPPVVVGGQKVTNERKMIPHTMTVTDVTGDEDSFTLDSHGFQYLRHASVETEFTDEERIKNVYYPEAEKLYKEITGASRVVIFNHQIRRGPANWHSLGERNTEQRGPLHKAHVDQSYDGALMMARHHLGAEADELLAPGRHRFQIINLWRPIKPVRKDPLAVADGNSVTEADLVAGAIIYPRHRAETWTIKANPAHRWYYKDQQRPDEPLLIKCFDSDTSVVRRAAHCAFRDPEMDGEEHRQSIDIRALVFH
ncbi:Gibberellin cluster GA4 desaturase [Colletotrichum fructicola]|uniref:Gibberellin cluster GA4 desaturase n=1 Tax=Colletotrichum fructicola (strain Nara gc5) TaxID=1213859 RepID=A0A7J6JES7_COLFN|nr:uncharacterized protein CGMCC3_g15936 [Colletotrichum fructicola]KAF4488562.1 Gibberellin cluster GA4 desaturase [Colletotrichum fructicola Nara gc5]KAE9567904.1 hypothetical protein CGMCC3_g15936 [Colletotrichum fructicola]KAF4426036.1 Gibberellin cluster GA4 desaturase [Colletotrichum fructicola]KAF4888210.1 Gibberellin cluster GA4 desaturase [Colletotrichum fructicola]KAF4894998.1 Gibberellin cluster GA4 desaturase [Colletotrichum fructicola]